MLKFFILIFTVTTLFIAIKFGFSNQTENSEVSEVTITHKIINEKNSYNYHKKSKQNSKMTSATQNELKDTIEVIFEKAEDLTRDDKPMEALKLYTIIVNELNSTRNIELLKSYAKANFSKAYIYKNSLHDNDKAIDIYNRVSKKFEESSNISFLKFFYYAEIQKTYLVSKDESINIYNNIIRKFENRNEIELIKMYSSAQFSKSYLLEGEETLDVYSEIIDKLIGHDNQEILKDLSIALFSTASILSDFLEYDAEAIEIYNKIIDIFSKYEDSQSKKYVSDALFSKSYLLMSENAQESMETYDELINRYEDSDSLLLSKNFKYSIINNIELALITNNCDDEYRELANKYLCKPDSQPQLQMFTILKESQISNQDEAIKRWKERYKDYRFEHWSFKELNRWNSEMEDSSTKKRIRDYLDLFMGQNSYYAISNISTIDS